MRLSVTADLNALVAGIYDGALDGRPWRAILADVARYFDASRALMGTPLRLPGEGGFKEVHNISRSDLDLYDAHFRSRNLWMQGHFKHHAGRDGAFTGDMFVSYEELANSEFYSDYLRPQDAYHFCASTIRTRSPEADLVSLTVTRGRRQRKFSKLHRSAIGLLAPHVQRALAIRNRMDVGDGVRPIFSDALLLPSAPVFLVTGSARILQQSAAAERIVRDGSFLRVQFDHLRATQDNDELVAAIREVSEARANGRFSRLLLLGGGSSATDRMHLLVATADVQVAGAVLVLPGPMGTAHNVCMAESLRSIYRLTPAESRLCELLKEGHSLREAADLLFVQASTAASQLKSIFIKMGISRQADLVRMLVDIAALARAGESLLNEAG
ncbi:MAG TPA: helix-turn-helix transcriptional regulator [Reyranella sp.]|nr:helix-turn-helix transcriptional regulator [Reyranella sp.]